MQIINNITLDLAQRGLSPAQPVVYAKQNDADARYIYATLTSNGAAWTPPAETVAMFRETKPDGTVCFYDSDENNTPAVVINGNTIQVRLVEQALTAAGDALCEINLYNSNAEKLTAFSFVLKIQPSVVTDGQIASTDYFNILTTEIAAALAAVEHYPYIGENGHWFVWSVDEFVDTEISATGPQGPQGNPTTVNGKSGGAITLTAQDVGAVSYTTEQTLSSAQKALARTNIGAVEASEQLVFATPTEAVGASDANIYIKNGFAYISLPGAASTVQFTLASPTVIYNLPESARPPIEISVVSQTLGGYLIRYKVLPNGNLTAQSYSVPVPANQPLSGGWAYPVA